MNIESVPILADAIKEYYEESELIELSDLFDIDLVFESDVELGAKKLSYVKTARDLVTLIEHANSRRFLEALVPSLLIRCRERIAHARRAGQSWDGQDHHYRTYHLHMEARLLWTATELGKGKISTEVTVSEGQPFAAKSEAREFLGTAETEVMIVDNYVGVGTLDCLRDVRRAIRLLSGAHDASIEEGFDRALKDFRSEGYPIEVRRHWKLHDRYILFNDRCWLAGSSLKDAGKKTFSMIELVDGKSAIVAEVQRKWAEATEYTV